MAADVREVPMLLLTIPGVKHVGDEVVDEGDLRFGDAARVPVKHRHHHREPLSLLLVRLQGGAEGAGGVRGWGTLRSLHRRIPAFFFLPVFVTL